MRRILYGDVVAVASVTLSVAPAMRGYLLESLMHKAHCADKFRKRFGRWCPGSGDGSLVAACSGLPRANIDMLGDPAVTDCMLQVFDGIKRWRCSQSTRGGNQVPLSRFGAGHT